MYPCKNCGILVQVRSKGLCPLCRSKELSKDKKPKLYRIPTKKKVKNSELGYYFEYHLEQLSKRPYSQESGKLISEPTTANICHILPKRKVSGFASVSNNLDNCVYYTLSEHTRFDELLDKREFSKLEKEFPNSWFSIVVPKIRMLLGVCVERNKFYQALLEYIEGL